MKLAAALLGVAVALMIALISVEYLRASKLADASDQAHIVCVRLESLKQQLLVAALADPRLNDQEKAGARILLRPKDC